MELYCVLCGERLDLEGKGNLLCLGCNARYDSVLLSETKVEEEGRVITELSLSMDFYVVQEKEKKAPPLQGVNYYPLAEATSEAFSV